LPTEAAGINSHSLLVQVVGQIYSELPKLRILNISKNLLEALPDNSAGLSSAPVFTGLTTLVLNRCAISWATVSVLGGQAAISVPFDQEPPTSQESQMEKHVSKRATKV
jgi:hypothetical protein